jgi:hypothetical protein
MESEYKTCNKCKRSLPRTSAYFYRKNNAVRGHADGLSYTCKECEGHPFGNLVKKGKITDTEKKCNKCGRWLPATRDYYHVQPGGLHGLHSVCKECKGRKFGQPFKREVVDGKILCTKCKEWLPANRKYFSCSSDSPVGLMVWCKKCAGGAEYKVYVPKPRLSNKEGYRLCCRCGKELPLTVDYFQRDNGSKSGFMGACKVCVKKARDMNKIKINKKRRLKRLSNITTERERQRLYREKNGGRINFLQRQRVKHKTESEKFATRVRSSIRRALRNGLKQSKTTEYLGCSIFDFKKYLISLFTEEMTWERFMNREIEIDHIKPIKMFDLTVYEQQLEAFHYTNCQPLWKSDNRSKGSRYNKKYYRGNIPQASKNDRLDPCCVNY